MDIKNKNDFPILQKGFEKNRLFTSYQTLRPIQVIDKIKYYETSCMREQKFINGIKVSEEVTQDKKLQSSLEQI